MKLLVVATSFVVVLTTLDQAAAGKDIFDKSTFDRGCQIIAKTKGLGKGINDATYAGTCSGIIGTLMVIGSHLQPNMRFCAPPNASAEQGAKVFMRYLDAHPARMHQPSIVLAIDSLREAWPCPRAN